MNKKKPALGHNEGGQKSGSKFGKPMEGVDFGRFSFFQVKLENHLYSPIVTYSGYLKYSDRYHSNIYSPKQKLIHISRNNSSRKITSSTTTLFNNIMNTVNRERDPRRERERERESDR